MSLPDAQVRLQYLQKASELLTITSPAAAAHIGSVRNTVAQTQGERETARSCIGCGATLVLGWTCSTVRDRGEKRSGRREPRLTKTTSLQCSRCNTITELISQKPAKKREARPRRTGSGIVAKRNSPIPAAPTSEEVPDLPPTTQSMSTSANTNRKARGKKSSLQSLLATQKKPAFESKGSALGLMDFMKL